MIDSESRRFQNEILPKTRYPARKSRPVCEQRFVRDFHGGGTRHRITVIDQETSFGERINDVFRLEMLQARYPDAASGRSAFVFEGDEEEEQLLREFSVVRIEVRVDGFGTSCQRASNPSRRFVALDVDHIACAGLEQLSKRVLQQRQSTRLVVNGLYDPFRQDRIHGNTDVGSRTVNCFDQSSSDVGARRVAAPVRRSSPNAEYWSGRSRKSARSVTTR